MSNQYFLARLTGFDPALRAADADRERIAERLRKAHAEGRLDVTEFQERLDRCYDAKTVGQLAELVRDLPRQEEDERRRPSGLRSWRGPLDGPVPVLIALLVIAAASGHHVFWLWLPVLFVLWRVSWARRSRRSRPHQGPGDWI